MSQLMNMIEERARDEATKQAQGEVLALEVTIREAIAKIGVSATFLPVHELIAKVREQRVDVLVHARLMAVTDGLMAKPDEFLFNLRDKVVLNSGGPVMTVVEILGNGTLMCEWVNCTGISRSPFPPECVVEAKPAHTSSEAAPDAVTIKVAAALASLTDAVRKHSEAQERLTQYTKRMSDTLDLVTEGGNAMRVQA